MSSESEIERGIFVIGECYAKDFNVNNCLDCISLVSCENEKAIEFKKIDDLRAYHKLTLFLNNIIISKKRKREIVCARINYKIRNCANRAKREIKVAIFSLFLNERIILSSQLNKLIFRVCNWHNFNFYFSNLKRSYPGFLSFGNRLLGSKFGLFNILKKIAGGIVKCVNVKKTTK